MHFEALYWGARLAHLATSKLVRNPVSTKQRLKKVDGTWGTKAKIVLWYARTH